MHRFTDQINMGNGTFTLAQQYLLHLKLEDAFNLLSGMQQTPIDTAEYETDNIQLNRIVTEINIALLGRKVP